jgi:signal transduction histidine kinase
MFIHPHAPSDGAALRFLASVGHELRNTMMPVVLLSDMLMTATASGEILQEGLKTINASGRLAERLIEDLLDFSRMNHGKFDLDMSTVDLHEAIHYALQAVDHPFEAKRISVALELGAEHHEVRGDGDRLLQVLVNLLSNAAKYSFSGGAVTIRTWNPDDHTIGVEISDCGVGISLDDLPHVFEPYFQAGRAVADAGESEYGSGLGLGLAISNMLIKRHGGSLVAMSEGAGRGASFHFVLPLASALQRNRAPRRVTSKARGGVSA